MPTPSKEYQVLECLRQGTDWTVAELVDATSITEKVVRKHLKSLVEHGQVKVEPDTYPARYFISLQ